MTYVAAADGYDGTVPYGRSGLKLPGLLDVLVSEQNLAHVRALNEIAAGLNIWARSSQS